MKVHSNGKPADIRMRLTKVFLLGKETAQQKAVFQVIIAGCLFYGNDALRSRGGCCICLLMASGLIAKRFSMWLADASEGEITHTTFSKRLIKLTVFIILPRLVYTSHLCGQSNMDDMRGGIEKTTTRDVLTPRRRQANEGNKKKKKDVLTRDFLTFAVRYLSRIYSDKTNGQEECWTDGPSDWPKDLGPWKNPSFPRDKIDLLWKKYEYLRSQVPNHKLNQEELKAFEDFKEGKIESVKSFMRYKTLADTINKIKDQLPDIDESHRMLLKENLQLVLSSIASTSKGPTAAETSSLPTMRKRESDYSHKSVQSKQSKTEMSNCHNYIHNNRREKEIVQESTQTTSSESFPVNAQNIGTLKSTAVESPLGLTAYANQSLWSLVPSKNKLSNTCIDNSESITNQYHTEAAALQSTLTSPTGIMDHLPGGSLEEPCRTISHCFPSSSSSLEEPCRTISHCFPSSSIDSGTQESNKVQGTYIELDQQKLSDKNVEDKFQFTQNSQNNNFEYCLTNWDDCMRNFDVFLKYLYGDT